MSYELYAHCLKEIDNFSKNHKLPPTASWKLKNILIKLQNPPKTELAKFYTEVTEKIQALKPQIPQNIEGMTTKQVITQLQKSLPVVFQEPQIILLDKTSKIIECYRDKHELRDISNISSEEDSTEKNNQDYPYDTEIDNDSQPGSQEKADLISSEPKDIEMITNDIEDVTDDKKDECLASIVKI